MTDSQQHIARLPPALLADILQHVSLHQRLKNCVRTCRTWQAAAVAATHSIKHVCHDTDNRDEMLSWLAEHGQRISSIDLKYRGATISATSDLSLQAVLQCCPKLQRLQLQSWRDADRSAAGQPQYNLRSRSSTTATRTQPSVASLTSLILTECQVPDLQNLSVLTQLVELELVGVTNAAGQKHTIPGAALSALQALTLLKLHPASNDALAVLSSLTSLCSLACTEYTPENVSQLEHLQQLTCLECVGPAEGKKPAIIGTNVSVFTQLTALKHLKLANLKKVDPAVLASQRHLHSLELGKLVLTGGAEGPVAVLGAVAQMSQLQHLNIMDAAVLCSPPPPSAFFSALVASSQLQTLECVLPIGAWRQVFQAGRQMPQLQTLSVETPQYLFSLLTADVAALVAACPGLRTLTLGDNVSYAGLRVTALKQLTALTALEVKAAGKHTVAVAAELSKLQALKLSGPSISYTDCYQLGQLTRLTTFGLYDMDNYHVNIGGTDRDPESGRPEVWEHLLEKLIEIEEIGVLEHHMGVCEYLGEDPYGSDSEDTGGF